MPPELDLPKYKSYMGNMLDMAQEALSKAVRTATLHDGRAVADAEAEVTLLDEGLKAFAASKKCRLMLPSVDVYTTGLNTAAVSYSAAVSAADLVLRVF
jgi:hypothetical protein